MALECQDPVFGKMTYRHRWRKEATIVFLGKKKTIEIGAKAYSKKPITDKQRASYTKFQSESAELLEAAGDSLKDYVNENIADLVNNWPSARRVKTMSDLRNLVEPTTLLFTQDGTLLFLLECDWDPENGIAVQLLPNIRVGSQDLFL
ncbi:DUF6985 domain-containing protein [Lapidilactobacillus luobeiensis]|uniref:DUF6985 domain-containing protein n=1 Tax=Lapidilactobacillus luobeiensis TaxID=2950371 RepID=UPI0021C333B8|nr:hypothetical protein [Lapidilactobacillus luobeiensis]